MVDVRTENLLQNLLRRESRSFLQYLADSYPWTTPDDNDALAELQRLVEEEREALALFARFLTQRRITPPHLGAYPVEFTTCNFVSLRHLVPMLVRQQRQAVADLERDQASLTSEFRDQVQLLLDCKRRHLRTLESLAAPHRQAVLT
jgi:hypothetical protein